METRTRTKYIVLMDDRLSNVCLMMLNFLMLDGEEKIGHNLNTLFLQSIKYAKRRQTTDEVLLDNIFLIYTEFFSNRYLELKKSSNYSDPFIYDQRYKAWTLGGIFFDDNEMVCDEDTFCYKTLVRFVTTWNAMSVVMEFPWNMEFGSLVANYNYLFDICDFKGFYIWFQTSERLWSGFGNSTWGTCTFDDDSVAFYRDMAVLSSIISNTRFTGLYLNDFFGFLGYSPTFDISSLREDGYDYASRNLLPIYGMDRAYHGEDWQRCVYRSTYQRWTKQITETIQSQNLGTS